METCCIELHHVSVSCSKFFSPSNDVVYTLQLQLTPINTKFTGTPKKVKLNKLPINHKEQKYTFLLVQKLTIHEKNKHR